MKLYSKKGEFTHELISGIGIQSQTAKVTHKQKEVIRGSKLARMQHKNEMAFNVATSFEKRDARKLERKKRNELKRRKKI